MSSRFERVIAVSLLPVLSTSVSCVLLSSCRRSMRLLLRKDVEEEEEVATRSGNEELEG